MKTRREIKNRLKQRKYRHLKRILRANFHRKPANCKHNVELSLETDGSSKLKLKMCGIQNATVCDPSISECVAKVADCHLFEPHMTKEEVREDFYQALDEASLDEILLEFPDIGTLMWVLDEPTLQSPLSEDPDITEDEGQTTSDVDVLAQDLEFVTRVAKDIQNITRDAIEILEGELKIHTNKYPFENESIQDQILTSIQSLPDDDLIFEERRTSSLLKKSSIVVLAVIFLSLMCWLTPVGTLFTGAFL